MKNMLLTITLLISSLNAVILKPIPQKITFNKAKVELGKELFFDPILSKDGTIACVNCHILPGSGAESSSVSTGINNQKGPINSPTVLNARYNFKQFWDGRADSLYEQASGPITNPIEMGNSLENMLDTLKDSEHYQTAFKKTYGSLTIDHVLDAIVEFEKTLITPNAKFDKFLRHEIALSPQETRGYELFQNKGCISCHNGINLGGSMFQKFGAIIDLNEIDTNISTNKTDLGRYNITKREQDKFVFKVPTLRNVALSAPYFHNATAKTLKEAIKTMAFHQLGVNINETEIQNIEVFLKTLTGETPSTLVVESK